MIGLPASGIHSNGYSLVRKIFFEKHALTGMSIIPELNETQLSDELLKPTKIYVKAMLPLIKQGLLNGAAHITGGGFVENIPRMLSKELCAEIHLGSWPKLPIFTVLGKYGQIPELEMFEIFNMGIGMVLAVSPQKVDDVQTILSEVGETGYVIGKVVRRENQPILFKEV